MARRTLKVQSHVSYGEVVNKVNTTDGVKVLWTDGERLIRVEGRSTKAIEAKFGNLNGVVILPKSK